MAENVMNVFDQPAQLKDVGQASFSNQEPIAASHTTTVSDTILAHPNVRLVDSKTLPSPPSDAVRGNPKTTLSQVIAEHKAIKDQLAKKSRGPIIRADQIHDNDVLFGRGGGTNRHKGNIYFRQLVSDAQETYFMSRKMQKAAIAKGIVAAIRKTSGRFLKAIDDTGDGGGYEDVGDKRAAEKTSQALREGLAIRRSLTKSITVQVKDNVDDDDDDDEEEVTSEKKSKSKKAKLRSNDEI